MRLFGGMGGNVAGRRGGGEGGISGLLKDGTFMLTLLILLAVLGFAGLVALATGGVSDVIRTNATSEATERAYTPDFVQEMERDREDHRFQLLLAAMGTAVVCTCLWAVARVRSPRPVVMVAGTKDLAELSQRTEVSFPLFPASGDVPLVVNDEPVGLLQGLEHEV